MSERSTAPLAVERKVWSAVRLIAQGLPSRVVVLQLTKEFKIAEAGALAIVRRAEGEILEELRKDPTRNEVKRSILLRTAELYRLALEQQKVHVALACLRFEAELCGVAKARDDAPKPEADEFADRSITDLEYYALKGHWPEESPKKAPRVIQTLGQLISEVKAK